MSILWWVLKSVAIIVAFHFVVSSLVHILTKNSWVKLPLMIILGLIAGFVMAWMHYVPFLLFFIWLALNKHYLDEIFSPDFEMRLGRPVNRTVHYVSTYSYIIVACFSAWFLQCEVTRVGSSNGESILLWKQIFGA